MDTIRTLLVVKCQRSAILLAHIAEETAALETMADIQKRKGWFAALASCKRTLTSIEVPSNDTYVPIKLGDWLADDVRTFLSDIFATLWRVQRKVAACERRRSSCTRPQLVNEVGGRSRLLTQLWQCVLVCHSLRNGPSC